MSEGLTCRYCVYSVPLFVRLMNGKQQSGYRMLTVHQVAAHPAAFFAGRATPGARRPKAARVDDRCPHCDGKGCEHCEPAGPVVYNGNTGEPVACLSH